MTDWMSLEDAYGPAQDVPDLLAAAELGADDAPAWNDLWGSLCHQGTVYTASYAALPLLADIAERHAPAGYVAALHLAGAIVASNDGPEDASVVRGVHADALARLRVLAERNLAFADGDTEFLYALQTLLAFEDGGVWQRSLGLLADGELPLDCPSCGEYLVVNTEGPQFAVTDPSDAAAAATHVRPVEPAGSTVGARMMALAQAHGRTELGAKIPYLTGEATCPDCDAVFELASALD